MFPRALLFSVAESIEKTPFPIFGEALIIMIVYEIMREAGLRLPRPVGHAVSIIGGLVIGDAAVKAGLIGSPMIMVVAITAISSFVLPQLYESVTILRLSFIVLGGIAGLYGLAVGSMVVLMNVCAVKNNGVPYTAPIAPFSLPAMRDVATRFSWTRLAKQRFVLQKMPGAHISKEEK